MLILKEPWNEDCNKISNVDEVTDTNVNHRRRKPTTEKTVIRVDDDEDEELTDLENFEPTCNDGIQRVSSNLLPY